MVEINLNRQYVDDDPRGIDRFDSGREANRRLADAVRRELAKQASAAEGDAVDNEQENSVAQTDAETE